MSRELAKTYDPKGIEDRLYQKWMDKKYFHAEVDRTKTPFTIVIPPPNITGQLHMGHALDETMQDILIRYKRMQGYNALWLPGTDHASIATEVKIIEKLKEEGIDKEDLGREGFLERAWDWKKEYGGRIVSQLKKLGSSCDWDRERFTMDEGCNKAVTEVFCKMHEKGWIYKGSRIINWCPVCNTSISDAEVEYEEQNGHFWHIKYPLVDQNGQPSKTEFLEFATTRPETMLGDTAVAVNPNDERYTYLKGRQVWLPIVNKAIPVVEDDYVDMEFGTGVVKITPAHDPNDFEVGLRHNLPIVRTFTYDGYLTGAKDKAEADELRASGKAAQNEPEVLDCGKYAGMSTMEARKAILHDLEEGGYIKEIEPLKHEVGTCYRCHTSIEPMVSKQWFVRMEPLAGPAIEAVEKGEIKFVPERFTKNYMSWMRGTRDWCISRQLWWGHRIPAWYCDDCGETVVSKTNVTVCPKCGSAHLNQDPDTLDTWFSSALWPFSTLGWPEETADLKHYYPTNTLVTGYDIIGFWVSRMIFSALEYTGKAPFDTVLIHGLVRDALGRKMSKSLGNGIDPLEIIDKYGADALRFTLATGNSPGNDMRFSDEKVEASRNFANKIWNAARFIIMNLGENEPAPHIPEKLALEDKWILSQYNALVKDVTDSLEKYELGLAVQKLYDFIWDVFCDWYIEIAKIRLSSEDAELKECAKAVLVYVMSNTLKLLHPFMPFITEEIWQTLPHSGESIMISDWPVFQEKLVFTAEEQNMEKIMIAVKAVRNRRAEMNVPPSKKAHLNIVTKDVELFGDGAKYFTRLASASQIGVSDDESVFNLDGAVSVVTEDATIYIPMDELVDFGAELERLTKEKAAVQKDIDFVSNKLNNQNFVAKAPAKLVEEQKEKLAKYTEKMNMIDEAIAKIANK